MTFQEDGACNSFCIRLLVMERPQGESFWRVPLTKDTQDVNQACVIQAVTQEGTEDDDGKFPSSGRRKHKNKVMWPHNEEKPPWKEEKKQPNITRHEGDQENILPHWWQSAKNNTWAHQAQIIKVMGGEAKSLSQVTKIWRSIFLIFRLRNVLDQVFIVELAPWSWHSL